MKRRMDRAGAGRGKRSPKSGQSNYFVGYKKHVVYGLFQDRGQWKTVPLVSLARAANVTDVEMMDPLLDFIHGPLGRIWPMTFAIGDKGYVSAARGRILRERHGVALLVRPKTDMVSPPGTDSEGCPVCAFGETMIWEDYDCSDGTLLYRGKADACARCPLSGPCPKRFEFPADRHETYWGMVPWHSRLSRELIRRFRPRVEPGFNLAKNKYRLKDFFITSQNLAQTLCVLSDITETLKIIAQERPLRGVETKKSILRDVKQLEIWDKI